MLCYAVLCYVKEGCILYIAYKDWDRKYLLFLLENFLKYNPA